MPARTPASAARLHTPWQLVKHGQAAGIAAFGLLCAAVTPLAAADLVVRYDQSQLLRLPKPAAEVIIGNPSIADVTVQGGNLLVITGKTFGVTNFIALDSDRQIIIDQRVLVERDERSVVHLHKASQRQSYACTPNCQPTITIGDDSKYLLGIVKDSQAKTKFSTDTLDDAAPAAQ